MKTLIYGAGPIGQWLALRLHHAGTDVSLLARNTTARDLRQNGIEMVDGLTGARLSARPRIVERVDQHDRYDLVVMDRESRNGSYGEIYLGEVNGRVRQRTLRVARLFEADGIRVSLEKDMDGLLDCIPRSGRRADWEEVA